MTLLAWGRACDLKSPKSTHGLCVWADVLRHFALSWVGAGWHFSPLKELLGAPIKLLGTVANSLKAAYKHKENVRTGLTFLLGLCFSLN